MAFEDGLSPQDDADIIKMYEELGDARPSTQEATYTASEVELIIEGMRFDCQARVNALDFSTKSLDYPTTPEKVLKAAKAFERFLLTGEIEDNKSLDTD